MKTQSLRSTRRFMLRQVFGCSLLLVAALFLAPNVRATAWTSTAAGGSWTAAATWTANSGSPAAGDSVTIATTGANSVTLPANTTIAGVTINSGGTLDENGYTLTNNGNFSNTGTVKNSANSNRPVIIFPTPASYSFTPGYDTLGVAVIGAGGQGGGNSSAYPACSGGGGGGCAYSPSITVGTATPFTVTVGAGPIAGNAASATNGGYSSFTNSSGSIALFANGGGGGFRNQFAKGGFGGTASGGTYNFTGGGGSAGLTNLSGAVYAGGGGGSAGTSGGASTNMNTATGGSGGTGSPAGGAGGAAASNAPGGNGAFPGGGGAGGWRTTATQNGGGGGNGEVVITLQLSPVPTLQPTLGAFTSVGGSTMTVNWSGGNGAGYIVLVQGTGAVNANPTNGTTYTANSTFGLGSQIGSGNYVCYVGSGTSVALSGLASGTTYNVAVYSLNGANGSEDYLTTSPATGSQVTTSCTPPSVPSAPTLTAGCGSVTVSWTPVANVSNYVYRSSSAAGPYNLITPTPVQMSPYVDSPVSPGATYYYELSAVGGCYSANSLSNSVTLSALPTATVRSADSVTNLSGTAATIHADLTGVSPWSVTWSNSTTHATTTHAGVAASPDTLSDSPTADTTYTVTAVSDANTCPGTSSGSATVTMVRATDSYATSGAATWTCPQGVTSVKVEVWGGGGAGGWASRNGQSSGTALGGGGAGGAYARLNAFPVTPGQSYNFSVGSGGVSVDTDTGASNGVDSWFNSTGTLLAKGGGGGQSVLLQNTSSRAGSGGTTNGESASIGDVVYFGGNGATATGQTAQGGGGGGSGGNSGNGNAGDPTTGTGVAAVPGGGNGGAANPSSGSGPGNTPTTPPGGGGGGARCASTTTTFNGGSGANGQVSFTYIVTQAPGTPSTTAATSIGSGTFTANWNVSPGTVSYLLDVSTDPNFGSFVTTGTTNYNADNVGNATSWKVFGLTTAGEQYYYRVKAQNAVGTSAYSNTNTVWTTGEIVQTLPVHDSFDYGAVQGSGGLATNSTYVSGYAGAGVWLLGNGVGSGVIQYTTNGLIGPTGFAPAANGAATVAASVSPRVDGLQFTSQTAASGATVYCSFLYQMTSAYSNTMAIASLDDLAPVASHSAREGTAATLYISNNLVGIAQGAGEDNGDLDVFATPGVVQYSPTPLTVGQTYLIVARYTFLNSAYGNNDTVELWVNPASSTYGVTGTGTPAVADAVAQATGAGDYTNHPALSFFSLFNNGTNTINPDNTLVSTWDEVRIGTTYASVTPGAPAPSFTGLTASPSIVYGTTSLSLGGQVSASGPVYPASGDLVSATINGHVVSGTVTDNTGDFTITYNDASLKANTVGSYGITYQYAGNVAKNLSSAMDASTTLTVTPQTPVITNGLSGVTLDYTGEALTNSSSILSGESGVTNAAGVVIPGSYAFTTGANVLTVGANQTEAVLWTPSPSHTNDYSTIATTVSVTVTPATPLVSTAISATAICSGLTLAGSTLSGAFTNALGATVGGTLAFADDTIAPPAGSANVSVIFTPSDADYQNVTNTVAVTVNPLPMVSVNSATVCAGSPATLTATTSASSPSYLWSPGGATTASITVSPASTTPYTVVVTDGTTGCSAGGGGTVTVNPLPTVSVNSATVCAGSSATLTATTSAGSPSYLWSPGGATTASITVSPASTTPYTVVVTDGSTGCGNSGSGTVTVNPLPTVSVNSVTNCGTVATVLTATSSAASPTYLWSDNETTASITNSPTATTNYMVTVTDGVTGCSATGSGSITVNPVPTVSVNSATVCAGESATLTATTSSTNASYLWSDSETTASITVTPGSTTTYTVVVTDGTTGCTAGGSGTVTVNPLPTVSVNSATVCAGESAVLTATTSASSPSYQWSDSETTPSITVTPGSTASYTVVVTDGTTGCTASGSGTVTVNPLPTTTAITGTNSVQENSMATYIVANTAGSTYGWSVPADATFTGGPGNAITVTFGVTSGNVTVVETNASGCTGTPQSLYVNVITCAAPAIVGGIDPPAATVCYGNPLILTLTNASGTAPLTYQWQTNGAAILDATNASYTNLTVALSDAANYACVVANGCGSITSAVAVVTISNTTPVVSLNGAATITLGRNQVFSDPGATAVDDCAGSLTPVESGSVDTSVPGNYTLTYSATNPEGNTGSASLSVTVTDAPPVAATFAFGAVIGTPVTVAIINGKDAPVSPYGDPLTVTSVSGASNGTTTYTTTNLTYTATGGTLDTLTYVVSDPYGTTANGQITVNIIPNGPGYGKLTEARPIGGNPVVLSFSGTPDNSYALDSTPKLTAPVTWTPQQTNTSGVNGLVNFTNTPALPASYYRTRLVP